MIQKTFHKRFPGLRVAADETTPPVPLHGGVAKLSQLGGLKLPQGHHVLDDQVDPGQSFSTWPPDGQEAAQGRRLGTEHGGKMVKASLGKTTIDRWLINHLAHLKVSEPALHTEPHLTSDPPESTHIHGV